MHDRIELHPRIKPIEVEVREYLSNNFSNTSLKLTRRKRTEQELKNIFCHPEMSFEKTMMDRAYESVVRDLNNKIQDKLNTVFYEKTGRVLDHTNKHLVEVVLQDDGCVNYFIDGDAVFTVYPLVIGWDSTDSFKLIAKQKIHEYSMTDSREKKVHQPMVDAAKEYLAENPEELLNIVDTKLLEEIRQYPVTPSDAYRDPAIDILKGFVKARPATKPYLNSLMKEPDLPGHIRMKDLLTHMNKVKAPPAQKQMCPIRKLQYLQNYLHMQIDEKFEEARKELDRRHNERMSRSGLNHIYLSSISFSGGSLSLAEPHSFDITTLLHAIEDRFSKPDITRDEKKVFPARYVTGL